MHLANDGVQKHTDKYGKFESANKLSMDDFHAYLVKHGRVDGAWLDAVLRGAGNGCDIGQLQRLLSRSFPTRFG